jgi:hypothetical protein|tara:strand:- start:744 stop:932 length:189 start_codon:yes stop_codon:yes gene_type:complete
MMEIILFTVSGIFLYVLADAVLNFIETQHGEPIPYRNVIFFVIIFCMAIILFQVLQLTYLSD